MRDELVALAVRGNADAAAFLLQMYRVADLADDLHDKDRPLPDDAVYRLTRDTLTLHANRYYIAHSATLYPLLILGLLNWQASNVVPAADACALNNVLFAVAMIEGGMDHALAVITKLEGSCHGLDG